MPDNNDPQIALSLAEIVVAIILFLAGIAVTAYFFRKGRERKELVYEELARVQLIGVKSDIREKVKVYYDGTLVPELWLIALRFRNSGTQPLRLPPEFTAYERPVNVAFSPEPDILDPAVIENSPENLTVSVKRDGAKVVVEPALLNPGDSFTVNLVSNGNTYQVDWRVEGVKAVKRVQPASEMTRFRTGTLVGFLGSLGLLLLLTLYFANLAVDNPLFKVFSDILVAMAVLAAILISFLTFFERGLRK